jgi:N-acetylneuraminate synthase
MLVKLDVPAFKIASFELVDPLLIRYAAQAGKPMILSTGMASIEEIDAAIDAAWGPELALLHCVSGYPTPADEANLLGIGALQEMHKLPVGLSDHTADIVLPIAATALGACIIEKHFKPRYFRGPDAKFSVAPAQFRQMVDAVHATWAAMQEMHAGSEEASRPLRRSLYVVQAMAAGAQFSLENVRSIRPGAGLPPKELADVIGKRAAADIAAGTPLAWELIA